MIEKFNQAKEMYNLKKQADMLKKEMEKIVIKVVEGDYELTMQGDNTVLQITKDGEPQNDLVKIYNKALKETQKTVAKKMRGQLSGLGFPGL